MNSSNVNAEQHQQQTQPLLDPNELPLEENSATTEAQQQQSRASQFMNNVSLDNLIRSNSFLHSDLGNFIEINPAISSTQATATTSGISPATAAAGSTMSAANSAQGFAGGAHTHAHSHSHNDANPTIVDLQDNGEPGEPNMDQVEEQAHPGASQGTNLVSFLLGSLQSSAPFFLILIAKIFHQHLLGFFIVLGFMTTLHWSNRNLVHQVELRDKRQNKRLVLLILFLLLNALVFFLIFKDYELYNCLVFMSPNVPKMDTWNLVWIVVCSDTIIKYMTICIKAVVTILPFKIMPLRKRGGYYSLIESSALFYRSLTPIHPWILFIFYTEKSLSVAPQTTLIPTEVTSVATASTSINNEQSTVFLVFLCILYFVFKINQLYHILKNLRQSVNDLNGDLSSIRISNTDGSDNICPICQDKLNSPVELKCKHIFCEDCVCVWLDKENSCPMCRAKIAVKKPMYKDGSTTIFIQWY